MSDDTRSDSNLRHFQSRSQRPNLWKETRLGSVVYVPVEHEQQFAQSVDDVRFKYVGTSTQVRQHEHMSARRTTQRFMGEHA
jgi:hypothetical protein